MGQTLRFLDADVLQLVTAHPLPPLSLPPSTIDAVRYAAIEDRLAALLATDRDTLVLGGEAILTLEALARGAGGPATRSVNLVSGPYGAMMGHWLGAAGGEVRTVQAAEGQSVEPAALRTALEQGPADVVCIVHAEAATGVVNPLAELAAAAHEAGAVVLVDAVASVGAERLPIDALDLDAVVIGPQKALSGPAGVAALVAGPRLWQLLEGNPQAPRDSILSLLDVRDRWLAAGRRVLPFYPHHLEMAALDRAINAIVTEGLDLVIARHHLARDATRAGLRTLDVPLWVRADQQAASGVTLLRPPAGLTATALLERVRIPAPVEAAPGPLADSALRVVHTGAHASLPAVVAAIAALADALAQLGVKVDAQTALDTVHATWSDGGPAA
jgi:aspartate aminotransferase-like enzyme